LFIDGGSCVGLSFRDYNDLMAKDWFTKALGMVETDLERSNSATYPRSYGPIPGEDPLVDDITAALKAAYEQGVRDTLSEWA